MAVPKVAAINDLSGLGKCSLTGGNTNFIGMRSAAVPMPTAVLSNQPLLKVIQGLTCRWICR